MQEINTEIHLKKKKNKKREYNMSEKKKTNKQTKRIPKNYCDAKKSRKS